VITAAEICPDETPCAECVHYFDKTQAQRDQEELLALQS